MAKIGNSGNVTVKIYEKGRQTKPVFEKKFHNQVLLQMLKEERDYITYVKSVRPVNYVRLSIGGASQPVYTPTEYTTEVIGPPEWRTKWEVSYTNARETTVEITRVELINRNIASNTDTVYSAVEFLEPIYVNPNETMVLEWRHAWTVNPLSVGVLGAGVMRAIQLYFEGVRTITKPFYYLVAIDQGPPYYEKGAEVSAVTTDETTEEASVLFQWKVTNDDEQDHTITKINANNGTDSAFYFQEDSLEIPWPKGSVKLCEVGVFFAVTL